MRTFILIFLGTILVFSGAGATSIFTVDGIKVSSRGTNAKQSKEVATISGEREALGKLLERITSQPTSSALLNIDSQKLSELVQSVEVNDEKVTASYYSATLSITFDKLLIEKFLSENKVNLAEKKGDPIVLVPLLMAGGQNMLFEEENPLRRALAEIATKNHLMNIIVPVNLRGIDKNKINQNIEALPQDIKDSLLKLGQNYKSSKLVLIVASQIDKEALDIRLWDIQDKSSAIKEVSFKIKDAAANEDIFAYTARGINSILENQWVKGVNKNNIALNNLTITVPFASMEEWFAIRKKIENTDSIKDISVNTLTVQYAIMEIAFGETFENLNARMNESGLGLQSEDGNIILRTQGVPIIQKQKTVPQY